MEYPFNYVAELRRREIMLKDLINDYEKQAALKLHYKQYPVDLIQDWFVTMDPRNSTNPYIPALMPFLLFKRQIEMIEWLQGLLVKQESGLVEKSRDIGATWIACGFSVWLWLFYSNAAIGWGSRKEQLVDNLNDPKTIFDKIRTIIEYLPDFLLPAGFSMKKHATYMKLINPENDASIVGEAGDNIGRGGRTLIYFKDESAHYEHAESIEAALGRNTNIQIDISSVNGSNNLFARKREDKNMNVFIFDWSDDPRKTQEWYDRERQRHIDQGIEFIFAQEVDRNYNAAVDMVAIKGIWISACIDAHLAIGWEPEGETVSGLDVADEGGDLNAQAIRKGNVLTFLDAWGEGDTTKTALRSHLNSQTNGVTRARYDSIGVGAGVKGKLNEINPDYIIDPFNAGGTVMNPYEEFVPGIKNKDMFENIKAQSWWNLRVRCEKTYKMRSGLGSYPVDELISFSSRIKDVHLLTKELSQPTYGMTKIGKIIIDKKPNGSRSPNRADAVVICYSPSNLIIKPYTT